MYLLTGIGWTCLASGVALFIVGGLNAVRGR
jgi:hypothetical protein